MAVSNGGDGTCMMIRQTVLLYPNEWSQDVGSVGGGVLYKAQDLKLERSVALKFLAPELTLDSEAKERFIHETKAASALQHNNICTFHDIDETTENQLFIMRNCCKGET